jgi:uncharacterized phage protein (TIGR02218 family)
MKPLPPSLAQHLAGEATTLCNCWRVTRADGVVLGFTDHDRAIAFDSTQFEAASGFGASRVEFELGLGVANQEVSGAFDSVHLLPADLRASRYDGARIETWAVNWNEPGERVLMHVSVIGEVGEADGVFRAEMRSLSADMDETRGRRFSRTCDASLGDSRCGVALDQAHLRAIATVVGTHGALVLALSGLSGFADGWFRGGSLRFETGANAGMEVAVAQHAVHAAAVSIELWKPMPLAIAAGDLVRLTAGCDKTFATCRAKFANAPNFRGFPHIPGNDFALGYASTFRVMDGGPLIP